MKYYQFASNFRPEIKYHGATTATIDTVDRNTIDARRNIIEFCINTTDADLRIKVDDEVIPFRAHDFVVLFPDRKYIIQSADNDNDVGANMWCTISAELMECQYVRCDVQQLRALLCGADRTEAGRWILLPERMSLNDNKYKKVTKLMRTIISHYDNASESESEYVFCIAKWFELVAILDQCVRLEVRQTPVSSSNKNSVDYYVRKTKKYMEKHYSERITIPLLAQNVGISPNYLSALFKEGTGETIVTYLNQLRMRHLRELLQKDDKQDFGGLCCKVGISDERYARRLFKKYYGVSVQHYKQVEDGSDYR